MPAPMFIDNYVPTDAGMAHGAAPVLDVIGRGNRAFDPWMHRPYFDKNGRPAVTVNTGRTTLVKGEQVPIREHRTVDQLYRQYGYLPSPVLNATTLSKEQWVMLDTSVLKAARYRLRAWSDLAAANTYGGFNGMAYTMLEHQTMSDPGEAIVDMDALSEGRRDRPLYQLQGLPLPITHSDFWYSKREMEISRNGNGNGAAPLDTTSAEAAGRRVAESIEAVTIGTRTGLAYGGTGRYDTGAGYGRTAAVYGYINFPGRLTKTNMTAPTAGGWTPETTQREINTALQQLRNNKYYGPFMIYVTNDWMYYLNGDYYALATSGMVAPNQTLKQRIKAIDDVMDIRQIDMFFGTAPTNGGPGNDYDATLKPFSMVFVDLNNPAVARAVNGMGITTVQWPTKGGLQENFKVMAIQVPQLRADYYGNTGILHATTS